MVPLAEKFIKDGFEFDLFERSETAALFQKRRPGSEHKSFEVVVVQRRAEHTWPNGSTTPAHESLPSSEQWGSAGWTYTCRDAAMGRFKGLSGQG